MPNKVTTVATSVSAAFAGGFSFPHVGGPRVIFSGYGGGSSDTQVLAAFAGDKVSDLLSAGGSHARFAGVADASSTTSATAFVGQAETATGVYILRDRRLATIATSGKSGFDGLSDPSLSSSSGLSSISFIGKKGSFRGLFIGRAWDDGRLTGAGDPTLLHELVNSTRSIPTQTARAPLACIQSPALSLPAGVVAFFGSSCDGDANSLRDSGRFRRSVTLKDHAIKPSAPANRAAGIFLVRVPKQDAKWPKPGSAQIEGVGGLYDGRAGAHARFGRGGCRQHDCSTRVCRLLGSHCGRSRKQCRLCWADFNWCARHLCLPAGSEFAAAGRRHRHAGPRWAGHVWRFSVSPIHP